MNEGNRKCPTGVTSRNPALIRLFEWVIWLNGLCTKCWKERKDFRK